MKPLSYRLTSAALALITAAPTSFTQQPPKFEAKSQLVVVAVRVRNDKGGLERNLQQTDFTVISDGQQQQLFSFDPPPQAPMAVGKAGAEDEAAPAAAQTEYNNINVELPRQLTIIALDPRNTPVDEIGPARKAVQKILESPGALNGYVALMWLSDGGASVIHNFSNDKASLARAFADAKLPADRNYSPGIDSNSIPDNAVNPRSGRRQVQSAEAGIQRASEDTQASNTADGLKALGSLLAQYPGEKSLIWITHGFRLRFEVPVMGTLTQNAETGRGTQGDWLPAFRVLNSANVSVYPVDSRGLVAGDAMDRSDVEATFMDLDTPGSRTNNASKAHDERLDELYYIAQQTGGQPLFNTNDLTRATAKAALMAEASYLLTFRVPPNIKPGWHTLQVKAPAGYKVDARPGYLLPDPKKKEKNADKVEMDTALVSPFAETGLPLMMRWTETKPGKNGKKNVGFQLAVTPAAFSTTATQLSLEIKALATQDDKPVATAQRNVEMPLNQDSAAKLTQNGFGYTGALELADGKYNVTFAVRDTTTNRIGTIKAAVTVQ